MIRLSSIVPTDIDGGINLLDLGASGSVPQYWKPLAHLLNVTGFDPNEQECHRLNSSTSGFLSQRFLPYAIAGESRSFTLYKTNSIYCWSLLEPNRSWLRRFRFSDLFEIQGTDAIEACRLCDVDEIRGMEIDAIKLDTQGLELPILRSAENMLRNCILIETETGFTENYIGETTFDQTAEYMRSMGFGLFALNPHHRVSRNNELSEVSEKEQMLWCEAVWLRDFCNEESPVPSQISRVRALKALCIYANHGCYAFGLEAAARFTEAGALSKQEYNELAGNAELWKLPSDGAAITRKRRLLRGMLSLIPRRYIGEIVSMLESVSCTGHPVPQLLRRARKGADNQP